MILDSNIKENNKINEEWNALNILIQNASTVGAADLGFFQSKQSDYFNFFKKLNNHEFKLLYFELSRKLIDLESDVSNGETS